MMEPFRCGGMSKPDWKTKEGEISVRVRVCVCVCVHARAHVWEGGY